MSLTRRLFLNERSRTTWRDFERRYVGYVDGLLCLGYNHPPSFPGGTLPIAAYSVMMGGNNHICVVFNHSDQNRPDQLQFGPADKDVELK